MLASLDELRLLRLIVFSGAVPDKSDIIGFRGTSLDNALSNLAAKDLVDVENIIVPTKRGVDLLEEWYVRDRKNLDPAIQTEMHRSFRPLDLNLKELASKWQDAIESDSWDKRLTCIEDLTKLHENALQFVSSSKVYMDRFDEFGIRLGIALNKICDGETDYFVGVQCDSYHTVWFHWHEDLLRLLQRERDPE